MPQVLYAYVSARNLSTGHASIEAMKGRIPDNLPKEANDNQKVSEWIKELKTNQGTENDIVKHLNQRPREPSKDR